MLHFSLRIGALLLAGAAAGMFGAREAAAAAQRQILVVGDSLSAEYGLQRGTGWVALLTKRLTQSKPGYAVVNASISGDTTAGGLSRLPPLLASHPAVVVIALGGNDGLRGLPLADTRRNLDAMATKASAAGAKVVLVGIRMPPNYGRQYNEDLGRMYSEVAAARKAVLVPFMLQGVADRADADDWFQADHIHPAAKAHPLILDNIWPRLEPLLTP